MYFYRSVELPPRQKKINNNRSILFYDLKIVLFYNIYILSVQYTMLYIYFSQNSILKYYNIHIYLIKTKTSHYYNINIVI